jgi:hypothetical protein
MNGEMQNDTPMPDDPPASTITLTVNKMPNGKCLLVFKPTDLPQWKDVILLLEEAKIEANLLSMSQVVPQILAGLQQQAMQQAQEQQIRRRIIH